MTRANPTSDRRGFKSMIVVTHSIKPFVFQLDGKKRKVKSLSGCVNRFPKDLCAFRQQEEDLLRGTGTWGSNKAESNVAL